MKIIAFDLGSYMAWAHNGRDDVMSWGSEKYPGERPERAGRVLVDLKATLSLHKFDVLVYETPFTRGRYATRSLWGLAGLLEASAHLAGMAVLDVAVTSIKKFATGDGHAPKSTMILAARSFGYRGYNEHEADAICLLKYAEENIEMVA